MNVHQRLSAARAQFHTLKLSKSGHNKFAGYKYFELADFLIPALAVFRENGLSAVISFTPELATMRIFNIEEPSQCITITSPLSSAALKGCHEVQNLGAVETYQRRYLWVAALEIVEHDAIDAAEPAAPKAAATSGPITPTTGAENLVPEERKADLDDLALTLIDLCSAGQEMKASKLFYVDAKLDSDSQVYVWKQLSKESKVRRAIKDNNPLQATAA